MKGKNGFTLIELLIVLAIIGILAVLIVMVVNNARDRAQETRLRSAVRQFRLLAEDFRDDNGFSYEGYDTCLTNPNGESCLTEERAGAVMALVNDMNAVNGIEASSIAAVVATETTYCVTADVVESVDSAQNTTLRRNLCIDSTGSAQGTAEWLWWSCNTDSEEETFCESADSPDGAQPLCGNGSIDAEEECDGADLAGGTCQNQGYLHGDISCGSSCQYDVSGCYDDDDNCDGANYCDSSCPEYDPGQCNSCDGTNVCDSSCPEYDNDACNGCDGSNVCDPACSEYDQIACSCDGTNVCEASCPEYDLDACNGCDGSNVCEVSCSEYDTDACYGCDGSNVCEVNCSEYDFNECNNCDGSNFCELNCPEYDLNACTGCDGWSFCEASCPEYDYDACYGCDGWNVCEAACPEYNPDEC